MAILKSTLAALATATMLTVAASAASSPTTSAPSNSPDVYRVNYFLNLTNGATNSTLDATITILDPGSNGSANLCADIYVLNPSEELEECCTCPLTPDEMITGSVTTYLTHNPLNGYSFGLSNGVIKIIADAACNPGKPTPTEGLVSWLTRVDRAGSVTGVTTTEFEEATLSTAERTSLATRCNNFQYASGYGICSCPPEPPNHY